MSTTDLAAALADMVATQEQEVQKLVAQWKEHRARGQRPDLDGIEIQTREWALRVGAKVLERLIQGIGETSAQEGGSCPKCGRPLESEGRRAVRIHTTMGEVSSERRYFHCPACGVGKAPLDEELGLDKSHNTPALQRITALGGSVAPFEKASALLGEIGSIVIGAQKVERVTEEAGARAEAWLTQRQQRALAGLEVPQEPPPQRLYVEADGTTVPMRTQREPQEAERKTEGGTGRSPNSSLQGSHRKRSPDQRTPGKLEYKEVKLGAVFEATLDEEGEPQSGPKTYTGTFGDAETCVRQVSAEAKARGSDGAAEIVVLGDGGAWIWNRLPAAFPGKKVTQILDCRHPEERLTEIGKRVFGEGSKQAVEWSQRQRGLLLEGRIREVLEAIEELRPKTAEAKQYVDQALGYLRDNASRMNYGELRAQGYFIGSGVIESSCGHIVGARLKQPGMSWSRAHVPKLLALRVCRASGWWDALWRGPLGARAA